MPVKSSWQMFEIAEHARAADRVTAVSVLVEECVWATTLGFWDNTNLCLTPLGAKFLRAARSPSLASAAVDAVPEAMAHATRLWAITSAFAPTHVTADVDIDRVCEIAAEARSIIRLAMP